MISPGSYAPTRAFQWDLARQVERPEVLLRLLPRYAAWGYQELYLHIEDCVEYPSLPGVARADAYTYRQFARLVEAATRAGLKVVPIVNLLGHTQYLLNAPALRDLNELRAPDGTPLEHGQICPLHPRTPEVAGKLLRDLAPFCTAGKVHVGLDESFHLGRCPRCRAEIARLSLGGHFAGHVNRLHALAAGFALKLGLWADMLYYLPEVIPQLPRDVTVYEWYYYPFTRRPRVELYNFAEADLAAPLRRHGLARYGCPMNGSFRWEPLPPFLERMDNILAWWHHGRRTGAEGFLVTSWESGRLALELTTAIDAAAAGLWLEPETDNPREMLARGFERVFGRSGRAAARLALAADRFPHSGYHRWQSHERWDTLLTREPLADYKKECASLARLCEKNPVRAHRTPPHPVMRPFAFSGVGGALVAPRCEASSQPTIWSNDTTTPRPRFWKKLPTALRASLEFRLYLARREVFVRRCARAVPALRNAPDGARRALGFFDSMVGRSLRDLRRCRAENRISKRPSAAWGRALKKLENEAAVFARALAAGRRAARVMWARTRNPRARGPNARLLARDAQRLRAWRAWMRRARRQPALLWRATPVCGAWQLQFTVWNFAPCLQKVIVEQQRADGTWKTLHGLFTIEFKAAAARPRTRIMREFSAPVVSPHVRLRLAVRGLGQVKVSAAVLTNGVTTLRAPGRPWRTLGPPAPRAGFPRPDWENNAGTLDLAFTPAR